MLFKENGKYGVSFEGLKGGRWDVMLREEFGQVGRQYWGLKTKNNQRQIKSSGVTAVPLFSGREKIQT